jgi:hypothetical protein
LRRHLGAMRAYMSRRSLLLGDALST